MFYKNNENEDFIDWGIFSWGNGIFQQLIIEPFLYSFTYEQSNESNFQLLTNGQPCFLGMKISLPPSSTMSTDQFVKSLKKNCINLSFSYDISINGSAIQNDISYLLSDDSIDSNNSASLHCASDDSILIFIVSVIKVESNYLDQNLTLTQRLSIRNKDHMHSNNKKIISRDDERDIKKLLEKNRFTNSLSTIPSRSLSMNIQMKDPLFLSTYCTELSSNSSLITLYVKNNQNINNLIINDLSFHLNNTLEMISLDSSISTTTPTTSLNNYNRYETNKSNNKSHTMLTNNNYPNNHTPYKKHTELQLSLCSNNNNTHNLMESILPIEITPNNCYVFNYIIKSNNYNISHPNNNKSLSALLLLTPVTIKYIINIPVDNMHDANYNKELKAVIYNSYYKYIKKNKYYHTTLYHQLFWSFGSGIGSNNNHEDNDADSIINPFTDYSCLLVIQANQAIPVLCRVYCPVQVTITLINTSQQLLSNIDIQMHCDNDTQLGGGGACEVLLTGWLPGANTLHILPGQSAVVLLQLTPLQPGLLSLQHLAATVSSPEGMPALPLCRLGALTLLAEHEQ